MTQSVDDEDGAGIGDDSTLPPPAEPPGEPVAADAASTLLPPPAPAAGAATARQRVVASGPAAIVDRAPAAWRDPAARDPLSPSERYQIVGEVGRGGLGRVLEAQDTWLGRSVAVKELRSGRGGDEPRFRREALITARLQHPGIVPVHDAGHFGSGDPFYTMKLVSGRSLAVAIRDTRTYADRLALVPVVGAVANAIAYAHSNQVIHRDLKPANVMLGDFGETIVIDWGLAKQLGENEPRDESGSSSARAGDAPPAAGGRDAQFDPTPSGQGMTVAGSVLGTPAYMSPEQARGEPLDERTDVYALGAMLYAVLTGAPPYRDPSPEEVLDQVERVEPPPLCEREPAVAEDLAAIVDKAMARQPAGRYPSASELAEDLARFETGQLVRAHSYSLAALFSRWIARHRAAVAVASIAAALMVSLGVVAIRRIVREKSHAEAQEAIANRQRSVAQDQANQVTLLQARSALSSDPTAALAWLGRIEIDADNLDDVRTIAQRATSEGVAIDLVHAGEMVNDLAFSPEGRELAMPAADGAVLLRDTRTGASRRLRGDDGLVMRLAYSPDGRSLAAGAENGSVVLWELEADQATRLGQHRTVTTALAFSPDGRWLASAAQAPELLLFERATGARRTLAVSESSVWDVAFSPDSQRLATAGADGTVRLVDLGSGASRTLGRHHGEVYTVVFSPDGDRVASVGVDGTVRLWSVTTATSVVWRGHQQATMGAAFSPDGRWLATTSQDNTVRVWDTDGGRSRVLAGHEAGAWEVAFSPDGATLFTSSYDGTVRQWDLASGDCRVLRGHARPVIALAISRDGLVGSGDTDGEVRLWSAAPRASRLLAQGAPVRALAYSVEPRRAGFAASDGAIAVLELGTRELRYLSQRGAESVGLAFLPGGEGLLSIAMDRTARLWDVETGGALTLAEYANRPLRVALAPGGDAFAVKFDVDVVVVQSVDGSWSRTYGDAARGFSAVSWAPAGRRYAVGEVAGDIQVVDLATDSAVLLAGHRAAVTRLAFSPDGRTLVSCASDGALLLWDLASRRSRPIAGACYDQAEPVFSADGRLVAVAQVDHTIRVVTLGDPELSARILVGHEDAVSQVGFSTDPNFLVSSGSDGTIRVWNLERGTSRVFSDHRQRVVAVAITSGPETLLSVGGDGDVRSWERPFVDEIATTATGLRGWLERATRVTISGWGQLETVDREPSR